MGCNAIGRRPLLLDNGKWVQQVLKHGTSKFYNCRVIWQGGRAPWHPLWIRAWEGILRMGDAGTSEEDDTDNQDSNIPRDHDHLARNCSIKISYNNDTYISRTLRIRPNNRRGRRNKCSFDRRVKGIRWRRCCDIRVSREPSITSWWSKLSIHSSIK